MVLQLLMLSVRESVCGAGAIFLVHHAIALGLHTTTLVLVKAAVNSRSSKLGIESVSSTGLRMQVWYGSGARRSHFAIGVVHRWIASFMVLAASGCIREASIFMPTRRTNAQVSASGAACSPCSYKYPVAAILLYRRVYLAVIWSRPILVLRSSSCS